MMILFDIVSGKLLSKLVRGWEFKKQITCCSSYEMSFDFEDPLKKNLSYAQGSPDHTLRIAANAQLGPIYF